MQIVHSAFDALDGASECDCVEDIYAPISLHLLTHMRGVPQKHAKRFYKWTNKLIGASAPVVSSVLRAGLPCPEIVV